MPRKAFVADVELLTSQAAFGKLAHAKDVTLDSATEVVRVKFEYPDLAEPVVVEILCGDIDSYPESDVYFLSVEHAPYGYSQAVEKVQESACFKSLPGLVNQVDEAFVRLQGQSRASVLPRERTEIIIHSSGSEDEDNVLGANPDICTLGSSISTKTKKRGLSLVDTPPYYDEEVYFINNSSGEDHPSSQRSVGSALKTPRKAIKHATGTQIASSATEGDSQDIRADAARRSAKISGSTQARIGKDLLEVCQHGYCFGVLAGMSESSTENLLAISVRTADLGLRPETLMTWDLDPDVFIVLLIHQRSRYIPYETLLNTSSSDIDMSFRIGKCAKYKPSAEDAFAFFGSTSSLDSSAKRAHTGAGSPITKILISTSLAKFMNDYFLLLAKYREDFNCSWAEAISDVLNNKTESANRNICPSQARTDLSSCGRVQSFPLLAMQFAMDQLKNCTQYCQACHSRLDKRHQSLKPTVCSRDLCLYQYISLGMGRSVEYEILCQSNVVDLLINFCYTALRASNNTATDPVRTYPTNLLLKVPNWQRGLKVLESLPPVQHLKAELEKPMVNDLRSASGVSPAAAVLLGWIVATNRSSILQIDEPSLMVQERFGAGSTAPPGNYLQFCLLQGVPEHDYEFQRQLQIETVAGKQHRTLLAWHGSKTWNWHSILRTGLDYAVAVNGRAFGDGVYFSPEFSVSSSYSSELDVQWPKATVDLRSVVSLCEVINAPHKFRSSTPHYVIAQKYWSRCRFLFARQDRSQEYCPPPNWPPPNQAVPMPNQLPQTSRVAVVSIGGRQMGITRPSVPRPPPMRTYRPLSPGPMPHRSITSTSQRAVARTITGPTKFLSQVPGKGAHGPTGGQIEVPLVMMPASHGIEGNVENHSRRPKVPLDQVMRIMDVKDRALLPTGTSQGTTQGKTPATSQKAAPAPLRGTTMATAIVIDEDSNTSSGPALDKHASVAARSQRTWASTGRGTSQSPLPNSKPVQKTSSAASSSNAATRPIAKKPKLHSSVTPFDPGRLDYASLPQLPVPSWCTSHAQRALTREIGRLQKVQDAASLPELGWYIDFSRLDNMFQWIVELHSFDLSLPLAKDMMALSVSSIVCELRFGPDYPMSPPLVRVIRPRFVPFLQGGGGNVTAGGAMCMELLTSTGWTPANQTDAVLLQVRLALCATDRPARLDRATYRSDYGVGEAFAAYERAAAAHGWTVPKDMKMRMTF
ncbi:hypothetical protein SEPCBS119000_000013 [Sporothrix epigloea]|uniref:UBC core domain-containing protein n=1 Tax=Sporothrix epigloea TaxID=1892477 RepID=A0ABP0D4F8_9PEZI